MSCKRYLAGLFLTVMLIICFNLYISPLQAENQLNQLKGDQLSITIDQVTNKPLLMIAKGNANVVYGDLKLRGEMIEYTRNTGKIKAEGQIVFQTAFNQQDNMITADQLDGNLHEEELYFSGNVRIENEEFFITAQTLDYQTEHGQIVLKGLAGHQPVFNYEQAKTTATAQIITIMPEEEQALFEGNVQGKGDGFSFGGDRLTIDLVTGNITLLGNSQLRFEEQGEE